MSPELMVNLIGEQPIPNLLPIRHCSPKRAGLVSTDRMRPVALNLRGMLAPPVLLHEVPAYSLLDIGQSLSVWLAEGGWDPRQILFNVTGGTKPMSLAAFRLAERLGSPVVYFQSEGGCSRIERYEFTPEGLALAERSEVREHLTLDDFLKAHGHGGYKRRAKRPAPEPGDLFEREVLRALEGHVSEVLPNVCLGSLEIDLLLRCRNQLGVAEVKAGNKGQRKEGIDQLSTASQREFLGAYTRRFLILNRRLGSDLRHLAEAHGIVVIELTHSPEEGTLSDTDREILAATVTRELGAP